MGEREDTGHPLVELTKARLRTLLREPEAVFWIFVFPILMALALGIAFRTRGPERVPIGVEDRQGAEAVLASLREVGGMSPRLVPAPQVERALRDGEVHLVVVPGSLPTYRYDPTANGEPPGPAHGGRSAAAGRRARRPLDAGG